MEARQVSDGSDVGVSLQAVLFDVGGTLDADGLPWSTQFHRAYRARGGTVDVDAFAVAFRRSDALLARSPDIARLAFRAMLIAQSELLAPLLPDTVDLAAVAMDVHGAATAIAARNRLVLDALRPHARLGVVSNFTGNVAHCLAELGLLPYFDVVLDSAVVGIAKPDPAIFRRAAGSLGAAPEHTLMVGDNPFADIVGATRAGLRTCWIAPAERLTPDGVHPTIRIARLTELPNAVGLSDLASISRDAAACTG